MTTLSTAPATPTLNDALDLIFLPRGSVGTAGNADIHGVLLSDIPLPRLLSRDDAGTGRLPSISEEHLNGNDHSDDNFF